VSRPSRADAAAEFYKVTREEFDVLVRRIEQGAGRTPKALRLRVAILAAVGYGGLLVWLGVVFLLAGLFFTLAAFADWTGRIFLGLIGLVILFGGGWAVLRVLLIRLPPPEGREVSRSEVPALYGMIDELGARLHSAPFHHVLIAAPCNAAVVQVPRLGVLGWSRNYLLLGLPLLEVLSQEDLRAVLAHEFAHLSREHGRFGRWIYRLRRSWERVFEKLAQPRVRGEASLRPLIAKFVEWFWPRFNAHAFVLSRHNEYEADALAAGLAGAENLASSLFRIALYDRQLEEQFWPRLWQLAESEAVPPSGVFLRLRDSLLADPEPAERVRWTEQAFRLTTTNADTHPCLTDRLRALNRLPDGIQEGRLPAPLAAPHPNAAESLLGSSLESIRSDVEQRWREQCEPLWRERHAKATALRHRLSTLEQAIPMPAAADVDGLWDKARVLLELHRDAAAEPLLRQILSQNPAHVIANFQLGRLLLEADRDEGLAHLEISMTEDEQLVPQASMLLHQFFRRSGQTERLRELASRLDRYERDLAASRAERSTVTGADRLIPHDLSEAELVPLVAVLAAESEVMAAELGRKELRHFPKQKLFLLCVHPLPAWHRLPNRDREQTLVNRLSQLVRLPGRVLVFAPSGPFRPLARKLQRLDNASVFWRGRGGIV